MSEYKPSREEFLARLKAKDAGDSVWDWVDGHIGPEHLSALEVEWAIETGLQDDNHNARDYAATIIARSDVPVSTRNQERLIAVMGRDSNRFVRHWLANALKKRGSTNSLVDSYIMEASSQNTPAGDFARKLLNRSQQGKK